MCKLTKNLPIQVGGCWIFRIQGGEFDKGKEIQWGLIPSSELCFGAP